MTDTATAAPTVAQVTAAAKPTPEEEIAALHARFDAFEDLIKSRLPVAPAPVAPAAPGVVAAAATATVAGVKKTGRAIACFYRVLDGFKTIMIFLVTGGLALATELQAIDLTPYAQMVLPEGAKVSAAQLITLLSLAGIGLRLVSKTPAFVSWTRSKITGGGSDSAVDEPADTNG